MELTPEHLVLIPDHQLFHCRGREAVPTLWLAFNVARRLMPQQQIPILLPPTRTERALMPDLTRLFAGESPEQHRDRIYHGSMALLHVVLNRPEIQWQGNTPAAVVQTVQYIEDHYASPLLIPRLARMANLCTEALARSFKRYQGETIGRFIVKVRVREAAHLLMHSDAAIEEIAERTGLSESGLPEPGVQADHGRIAGRVPPPAWGSPAFLTTWDESCDSVPLNAVSICMGQAAHNSLWI